MYHHHVNHCKTVYLGVNQEIWPISYDYTYKHEHFIS